MSKRSYSLPTRLAALIAVTAVCGLHITAANATDVPADLTVSAHIDAGCTISTTTLDFGAYDPTAGSNKTGAGSVDVTCTLSTPYTVTLGQGLNPVGSNDAAPVRQMNNALVMMGYFLYAGTNNTTVWGNDATSDVAGTGSGTLQNLDIFGEITAGQNLAPGSFSDTVVATISF